MTSPTRKDARIPYFRAFKARFFLPAPIFCATNADIACEKADGTSIINAHTFSATPTPAEAMTSMEFTTVRMTRNEIPTSKSCSAIGVPRRSSRKMIFG